MFNPTEMEFWFAGKDFSTDWTSGNFPNWCRVFADRREKVRRILEIGSWEGRSAIFFLEFFRNASITCIDAFASGGTSTNPALHLAESRFDKNTKSYGARVTKIAAESVVALHDLIKGRVEPFDLIYVDGSHFRDDVVIDSLMMWRLSAPGTIVIWDDYEGGRPDQAPETRVKAAIDYFLSLYGKQMAILHRGYQIIAQRVV